MSETFDLRGLRKSLGLNQAEMAKAMGLGSRAYFTLEDEPDKVTRRHKMLAAAASLDEALKRKDPTLASAVMRRKFEEFTALLLSTNAAMLADFGPNLSTLIGALLVKSAAEPPAEAKPEVPKLRPRALQIPKSRAR